jgi:pheromone a factor receptor
MALSSIEILGTIPIGTYFIVDNAREGVGPWESWAFMHSHYSEVSQVPASIWKNNTELTIGLEMYRWLLVACAFIFFAFFGFADEALQHYRLVYTSLTSRIGYPTSTLRRPSHVCVVYSLYSSTQTHCVTPFCSTPPVPHANTRSKGGVNVSVVTTRGEKHRSSHSLTDKSSIKSTSITSDLKPDPKIEQHSPLNSVALSSLESFDEPGMQGQSNLLAGIMPAVPPASVPPQFPDKTKSIERACSGIDAV